MNSYTTLSFNHVTHTSHLLMLDRPDRLWRRSFFAVGRRINTPDRQSASLRFS